MRKWLLGSAVVLAAAHTAAAQEGGASTASFINGKGEPIGEATVTATPGGVLIELDVEGLTPESWVSFHIHENGACDPASNFETAGGHFNPQDARHGFLVEGGPHLGDMPNQYVGSDGALKTVVYNSRVGLEGEDAITGRAFVIHGGQDDYKTQPSGDAGPRIACAIID